MHIDPNIFSRPNLAFSAPSPLHIETFAPGSKIILTHSVALSDHSHSRVFESGRTNFAQQGRSTPTRHLEHILYSTIQNPTGVRVTQTHISSEADHNAGDRKRQLIRSPNGVTNMSALSADQFVKLVLGSFTASTWRRGLVYMYCAFKRAVFLYFCANAFFSPRLVGTYKSFGREFVNTIYRDSYKLFFTGSFRPANTIRGKNWIGKL
ncbi:hypothetical protein BKA66DRAFT_241923 [Pyrenochaeta sp. MPI-SDFR-AT-0127]|nr:hypothetical protein BKA66DRAFT_241923 [Pyrenochaeta sp. MPI-SDFR-AT-0127]